MYQTPFFLKALTRLKMERGPAGRPLSGPAGENPLCTYRIDFPLIESLESFLLRFLYYRQNHKALPFNLFC
jgi:hypothetical protein